MDGGDAHSTQRKVILNVARCTCRIMSEAMATAMNRAALQLSPQARGLAGTSSTHLRFPVA